MNSSSQNTTAQGLFWKFLERFGAQGVTFFVSIILARLIDPEAYGTIAIITVFINIFEIFISSGMGSALVQKKTADDLDFSSLFFFNLTACTVLYLILFFSAPLIASIYDLPELIPLIRVLGITLIISGVKNIQSAYVSRNMQFKRFFFATLGGTIGAAILGIWMAYMGFGVWALIAQSLFNNAVDTVILWITVDWKPKKMFSGERLRGLFSYGWKLLVSELLSSLHGDICQLIIGGRYSKADLAYYNKAQSLPDVVVTNINSTVNSVMFPAMARAQDDPVELKSSMRRTTTMCSYIMWPMMAGIAVCSKPLVRFLLTDKWLPAVPFIWIFCIKYSLYPINLSNINAIKSIGRSDIILRQETLKKILGLVILLATLWNGVLVFALGQLLTDLVALVINTSRSKKLLFYSLPEQLKDLVKTLLLTVIMGGAVFALGLLPIPDFPKLLIQVSVGAGVYLLFSWILKSESLVFLIEILKKYFSRSEKEMN